MGDEAAIAHLLRRTSFGPFPGQVAALAPGGINAAINTVLAAPPVKYSAKGSNNNADTSGLEHTWLKRMALTKAGLHEKMVWFWHGHFTSAGTKVASAGLMARQHNLLRTYALGNFREFAYQATIDGAMLRYLDGAGSTADSPNENYARELQELFTIGRANVTQANVVNAAKALSGWYVDNQGGHFDAAKGNNAPVPLVFSNGTVNVTNARNVTDALCSHPECAPFIVNKLHSYLAGAPPTAQRLSDLVGVFTGANLEIRPLVEAIIRDPSFLTLRMNRPRYPVEWITAARVASGVINTKVNVKACEAMGQIPFEPPSVAGWGTGTRWLSASVALAKAAFLKDTKTMKEIQGAADPIAATLTRCSLYEVTSETMSALTDFTATITDKKFRAIGLLALALASPEFALA